MTTDSGDRARRRSADDTPQSLLPQNLHTRLSDITTNTTTFLTQNHPNLLPSQTLKLQSLLNTTATSLATLNPITPFLNSLHMSSQSFNTLLKLLTPSLHSSFPSHQPNHILGAALYRLAHGADYRIVGKKFGMNEEDACRAFFVVCKAVHLKLADLFELRSDMERIATGFLWMGLLNCCGVIGMERFEVGENGGGVMVQAVVDAEGRFVDVSAGWPSGMDFGTILRRSKIYDSVEECGLLDGGYCVLSDGMSVPQYLIGEAGFPLLPWLMTPYGRNNEEDSFSSKEKAFNAAHASGVELVRTAFAKVKGRWRLLAKQWKEESLEFLPFVIVTGCLLHNFLIKCNECFPDEESVVHLANVDGLSEGEEIDSAHRIRDALAAHFSLVSSRT